jgi:ornithine cyclodeaminase
MKVISLDQIKTALKGIDLISLVEKGFEDYSAGKTVVPPVGELSFDNPPGEVHIKYGYIKGDDYYVIKIASGFYENEKRGLPNGNGMMLLFSQQTGQPLALLADEGYLTDVRTAVAGAIATKYCAPKDVSKIGIFGTGIQGRMQLEYLLQQVSCRKVMVWGRSGNSLQRYREAVSHLPIELETTTDESEITAQCNLIVSATPAKLPLIHDVLPGTHITAVGSDTPDKNEVSSEILAKADLIVADSISQCKVRGEISQALRRGLITQNQIVELGEVISGQMPGRTSEGQISIVDLTGVAVQDIQIARGGYENL